MTWQSKVLFAGTAKGSVLRFDKPISFWGGINPVTSAVTLAGHPQHGATIADKILVIPSLIGSSSSSAIILELFYKKMAPKALILGNRDAILPVGVVVAKQMDWPTIPVVVLADPPFQTGEALNIDENGMISEFQPYTNS